MAITKKQRDELIDLTELYAVECEHLEKARLEVERRKAEKEKAGAKLDDYLEALLGPTEAVLNA